MSIFESLSWKNGNVHNLAERFVLIEENDRLLARFGNFEDGVEASFADILRSDAG